MSWHVCLGMESPIWRSVSCDFQGFSSQLLRIFLTGMLSIVSNIPCMSPINDSSQIILGSPYRPKLTRAPKPGANSPLNLKSRLQPTPSPTQWPPSDPVPSPSQFEHSGQPSAQQGPQQTTSSPHPHPPHQPKHPKSARTQHPPSPPMNSPTSRHSPAPGGTQWAIPESCT